MIDCVNLSNCFDFDDNLLLAQHRLRYREVIQKEQWRNVYVQDNLEFDAYDNLATEYLIARDAQRRVVGVTRTYPTTLPYMLRDVFSYLSAGRLPDGPTILEASRMVLDRTLLSRNERRPVVAQLVVAYIERGLQRKIDGYIGFMMPKIWTSTFIEAGWDVQWLGPETKLPGAPDMVRAGFMPVSKTVEAKVRRTTGIAEPVVRFGAGRWTMPGTAVVSGGGDQNRERVAA